MNRTTISMIATIFLALGNAAHAMELGLGASAILQAVAHYRGAPIQQQEEPKSLNDEENEEIQSMYAIGTRSFAIHACNRALHKAFKSSGIIDPIGHPYTAAAVAGAMESIVDISLTDLGLLSAPLPEHVAIQAVSNLAAAQIIKKMQNALSSAMHPTSDTDAQSSSTAMVPSQPSMYATAQSVLIPVIISSASGHIATQAINLAKPHIYGAYSQMMANFGRNYTEKEQLIQGFRVSFPISDEEWPPIDAHDHDDSETKIILCTESITHHPNTTITMPFVFIGGQDNSKFVIREALRLKYWKALPEATRYEGDDNSVVIKKSEYGTFAITAAFCLPWTNGATLQPAMHDLYRRVRERHILLTGKPLKEFMPEIKPPEPVTHVDL